MKRINILSLAVFFIVYSLVIGTTKSVAEIRVYDGSNNFLGIYLGGDRTHMELFIPSINLPYKLNLDNSNWLGLIYYTTEDCSGTKYMPAWENPPFPAILKGHIENTAECTVGYYVRDINNPINVVLRSKSDCLEHPAPTCIPIIDQELAPATPLTQVEMPFTEPIERPIGFEYNTNGDLTYTSASTSSSSCFVDTLHQRRQRKDQREHRYRYYGSPAWFSVP